MNLEFARKTIYGRIDSVAVENRPAYSFRDVRDDFKNQFPELLTMVDCIQLLPGHRIRLTCTNCEYATLIISSGLSFRGFPVTLAMAKFARTVRIHRLPHELDVCHVKQALSTYGEVESLIRELDELFTGVLIAKMTITQPIPSRIAIKGQNAVIVYKGQIRTCFTCGSTTHENRTCPKRRPWIPIVLPNADVNRTINATISETPNPVPPPLNPSTSQLPSTQLSSQQPPLTSTHTMPENTPLPHDPQPIPPSATIDTPSISPLEPPAPLSQETPNDGSTWTLVTNTRKRLSNEAHLLPPPDPPRPNIPKSQARKPNASKPQPINESCVRKRTAPTIAGSFGKKTPSQTSNEVSNDVRDRSPLGFRATNSGNLSFSEVVTRNRYTIPNPPYHESPDEESSDISSSPESED